MARDVVWDAVAICVVWYRNSRVLWNLKVAWVFTWAFIFGYMTPAYGLQNPALKITFDTAMSPVVCYYRRCTQFWFSAQNVVFPMAPMRATIPSLVKRYKFKNSVYVCYHKTLVRVSCICNLVSELFRLLAHVKRTEAARLDKFKKLYLFFRDWCCISCSIKHFGWYARQWKAY
jgi:hypothetical protein